jgi:nucleotide-binding universal stress UspA family protein
VWHLHCVDTLGSDIMRRLTPPAGFRSILCGIDFSRESAMALRHAAALVRARRARLTAVFAVDPLLSAAAAAAYDTRGLAGTARLELQRFVRTTLGPRRAAAVGCMVVIGKPARAVLATAQRLGADLIVAGTHGLSGTRKVFFGSTTEAILRRSSVPVLAVPHTCRTPRRGWPGGVMVATVDLDDNAAAQASAAARTAKPYGAALSLVHAVPDLRLPLWLHLNERTMNRSRVTLAQEWLDARIGIGGRHATPETQVIVGHKADAIAAFAAAHHADVLILAVPSAGGLGRFRQGGAAYRLVCRARCPVLVLHVARNHISTSRRTPAASRAHHHLHRRRTMSRQAPVRPRLAS